MDTSTRDQESGAAAKSAIQAALEDAHYHAPHTSDELTARNVDTVVRLEREMRDRRTTSDRWVDMVTAFCGSLMFVWLHCVWFAGWVLLDIVRNHNTFDPFPYQLLTLIVSLEAILLSTFILISQNRDAKLNDRRNHLALQIALLSEQENTKILKMLDRIAHKMEAADESDPTIEVLEESTRPEKLVEQIDQAMEAERARQHHAMHLHMPHIPHFPHHEKKPNEDGHKPPAAK